MLVFGWQLLLGALCIIGAEAWLAGNGETSRPLSATDFLEWLGQVHMVDLLQYHFALPDWVFERPLARMLIFVGAPTAALGHFLMKLRQS